MLKIYHAKTKEDIEVTKQLFFEYLEYLKEYYKELAGFPWLEEYYQTFEKEINALPGKYNSPGAFILLAKDDNEPAGCVALEGKSEDISEMQRLYIRAKYRRKGVGTKLCKALIEQAQKMGYTRLRLHTALEDAKYLYKSLGFAETEPDEFIPLDTIVFMELNISS